jgi:hypothetical protein
MQKSFRILNVRRFPIFQTRQNRGDPDLKNPCIPPVGILRELPAKRGHGIVDRAILVVQHPDGFLP